jgi:large subunit ribosomal protein L4
VLEDFTFDKAKTKSYLAMLHNLAVQKVKTLLILSHSNNNLLLSARNLPQANVVMLDSLNTYDVLNAQELLISESALKKMEEKLA